MEVLEGMNCCGSTPTYTFSNGLNAPSGSGRFAILERFVGSTRTIGPHKDLLHKSSPSVLQTLDHRFRARIAELVSSGVCASRIAAPVQKIKDKIRNCTSAS